MLRNQARAGRRPARAWFKNYYRDNSKFPDTIVYHMKHTNTLVHRAILELQKSKIYA